MTDYSEIDPFILNKYYVDFGKYVGRCYTNGALLHNNFMFDSGQRDADDRALINYVHPLETKIIEHLKQL